MVFLLKTNKGRLKVKPLTERWIAEYRNTYQSRELPIVAEHPEKYQINHLADALKIEPNKMQVAALEGIQSIREQDEKRALIVSATGARVIIVMGAIYVIKSSVSGTLNKCISCIA